MNPQIIAIKMDDNCKLCSEDVVCTVVDVQCHICGVFHFSTMHITCKPSSLLAVESQHQRINSMSPPTGVG